MGMNHHSLYPESTLTCHIISKHIHVNLVYKQESKISNIKRLSGFIFGITYSIMSYNYVNQTINLQLKMIQTKNKPEIIDHL